MYLLVVESPNKIFRLKGILGPGWNIISTKGHIEDLPKGRLGGKKIIREDGGIISIPWDVDQRVDFGIDISNGFKPFYVIASGKEQVVTQIASAISESERVFIATDPDREGEAIAWSVAKLAGGKVPVHRVSFNSITKQEVTRAIQVPGDINMRLVQAAHARRVLDRLIGFFISPLADAVINGNGAEYRYTVGRVQSPALAIIAGAVEEYRKHSPKGKYRLRIDYDFYGTVGAAGSSMYYVTAFSNRTYSNKAAAYEAAGAARSLIHTVKSVKAYRKSINPPRALKTSTMQARAFTEKGLSIPVSSYSAQGMFQRGLITYPRTDSERLSQEGIDIANTRIMSMYGERYIGSPPVPGDYEFMQGAHEAVRPASLKKERIRTDEEKALYDVIDKYFIASRMSNARVDETTVVMSSPIDDFIARYMSVSDDGFTKHTGDTQRLLCGCVSPPAVLRNVKQGSRVGGLNVSVVEEPDRPPRVHDEASLILACERDGIGRPSTYPDIVRKLRDRGYIEDVAGGEMDAELDSIMHINDDYQMMAVPDRGTDLGFLEASSRGRKVLDYLSSEHPWVVDIGFTREVEQMLDGVANGDTSYSEVIGLVWKKLVETVPDVAFYSNNVQPGGAGTGMSPF